MSARTAVMGGRFAVRTWRDRSVALPVVLVALAALAVAAAGEPMGWTHVTLLVLAAVAGVALARSRQTAEHAHQEAELEMELRSTIRELRRSRARMAHVADAERRRIERDLHDGCQQRLIAVRVKLALAEELCDGDNQAVEELIQDIALDAETAIEDLHALVHGIYPSLLVDRGLPEAVKSMARAASVPARVLGHDVGRYAPDVEAAVYFTCAEALQNTAKHAGPGVTARIVMRQEGHGLAFEVRDDGCGFDATARSGVGRVSMEDRLEAVGGRLRVVSAPGCGTVVQGWVPDAAPAS